MLDKDERGVSSHDIPHHAAADSSYHAYENPEEQVMEMAVFQIHGGADAHDSENAKAYSVQCAHEPLVPFKERAFQQFFFQIEYEKQ